jgi:hypothetical protein
MKPNKTLLTLITAAALAMANGCVGSTVHTEDDDGAGGAGSGSSTGGSTGCAITPPDCPTGGVYTDDLGCWHCDDMVTCGDCAADQTCLICVSGQPDMYSCKTHAPVVAGTFECKWLACNEGDICLDGQPQGDGCEAAACMPVPAECVDTPTCDCYEQAFSGWNCREDADGNATVSTSPGF